MQNRLKAVMPYVISIIIGILVAVIVKLIFCPLIIRGESMEPTYHDSDIVRCTTDFTAETLKRGEVIAYNNDGKIVVKRIIALPGEEIAVMDRYVYIDGVRMDKENVDDAGILAVKSVRLEVNEYFCLGDNREKSRDSRYTGPVQYENIRYRVEGLLY